jgi:sugar lactone lactonase YvrE
MSRTSWFCCLATAALLTPIAGGAPAPALAKAPDAAPTAAAAAPAARPAYKVINVGTRPESVTRGFGGKWFVSVMGGSEAGDGGVKVIDGDVVKDYATEMEEPKGICFTGKLLLVTDVNRIWSIDGKGFKTLLVDYDDFPQPPSFLNDIACEPGGKAVYVTDMGANTKMRDPNKKLWPLDSPEAKALPAIGRVYRVGLNYKVTVVADASPQMPCPNGVAVPARGKLLINEFFTGTVFQHDGKGLKALVTGLRGADGVEQDARGDIYVSSWEQGKLWRLPRAARGKAAGTPVEPVVIAEGFQSAADFYLDAKGKQIVLPDMKAGTLSFIPLTAPPAQVMK